MVRIDRHRLERLLQDFHLLTGFRLGVFDLEGREVCAWPPALSPFCEALRAYPDAAARCIRCDREGFRRVASAGRLHTYRCHAGLIEALMPLRQDGEDIGYLMIGQLASRGPGEDPWAYAEKAVAAVGAPARDLRPLFDSLGTMDPARIRAAFDLVEMGALHLIRDEIVRKERTPPEESLRLAVRNAVRSGAPVEAIAREAGLGRTSAYRLSRVLFGEPVGVRIRSLRLEEARRLLADPDASIAYVAAAVGVQSPTYFARWFRKRTGMSPSEYRRAMAPDPVTPRSPGP